MNYLVTGGAGFIGSALIRHLINNTSHEVLNYDALKYISDLRNTEYAFIGWLEIKKGSKLIWIIDHNLINNQTDAELLQKINTFLFGFDDEWVDEWT